MVFMLYGVISKCVSLNSLCKNLLFLEEKLSYLGIDKLPAKSALSDANINRDSEVFASIYTLLHDHYKDKLNPKECCLMLGNEFGYKKIDIIDSLTITLFVDVFKGAGRNPIDSNKKGGLKFHAKLPLGGSVPNLVSLSEVACNYKTYLGQLQANCGTIYIYDKGYAIYGAWSDWNERGAFFVTSLNENASYKVLEGEPNHVNTYADGGIISDQIIELTNSETVLNT